MIKTIDSVDFEIHEEDWVFNYQNNLTQKLDNKSSVFSQETINEIILWKVNRYSELSSEVLSSINSISVKKNLLDKNLTIEILKGLIRIKGIKLPMASTILRFRNPKIYQIIDQRVYRILYGKRLIIPSNKSESGIDIQIDLYLKYLSDLRAAALKLNIPFDKADRILYNVDKWINKSVKLENY